MFWTIFFAVTLALLFYKWGLPTLGELVHEKAFWKFIGYSIMFGGFIFATIVFYSTDSITTSPSGQNNTPVIMHILAAIAEIPFLGWIVYKIKKYYDHKGAKSRAKVEYENKLKEQGYIGEFKKISHDIEAIGEKNSK